MRLITKRRYIYHPSWHIVYEWEEDIYNNLQIPLSLDDKNLYSKIPKGKGKLYDILCKIDNLYSRKRKSSDNAFFFLMNIFDYFPVYPCARNISIPYIIDFFVDEDKLAYFYTKFKKCPLVLVSSFEAYNFLKERKCLLNVKCIPLSLSDRYKISSEYIEKKYDVIALGRTNPILMEFLETYLKENPNVEFVYQKNSNKGDYAYYSTKTGKIGEANSRADYMEILGKSKIALYSTPGMDNSRSTNGFNPVTPKFLELISKQCHIIARYPDTEECRFFEMGKISRHIDNYQLFKDTMNKYLATPVDLKLYGEVLEKHYTSKRIINSPLNF